MRNYQSECIETIKENFKNKDRQLIQLPTGSGKTWVFCKYLKENSKSALLICPSIDIKYQILETLKLFNISSISDKLDYKNYNVITACCLGRDKNMQFIKEKKYDHIIIDEAHHAQSNSYIKLLENIDYPCKVLGLTATPERLDKKCLLDIFYQITYKKNICDMIEEGYLSDICSYRIKTGQIISKRGQEFRQIELRKLDNEDRNSIIVKTIIENCKNKKTLVFCLNIEHSEKIAYLIQKNSGIKTAFVHGKMNKNHRKEVLEKFKTGEIQIVTNCQVLTEGFDEPSIEAIVITRPTASKALYCQMIGRGLRKTENKNLCYLYELTDNNHKICTFNVACDKEPEFQREYKQGIRLTELKKEIEEIHIESIVTKNEKFSLFLNENKLAGNSIKILHTDFQAMDPTPNQYNKLNKLKISYHKSITFLEAAFLIWYHKLKVKYGYN